MADTQYNKFARMWLDFRNKKDKWDLGEDYVEKPAMYSLLGNLSGKTILCLGCGSGEECGYLKNRGAKKVIGIDISRKLINFAKDNIPGCEFKVANMEKLNFNDSSFDIVFSSLAINYVKSWTKLFLSIRRILRPSGFFLFSVPHPIKWAAETRRNAVEKEASFLMGYKNNRKTGEYHIYGDYLNARKIVDKWFNNGLYISFYVKPLSLIFREVLKSGFEILQFLEPKAVIKTKKVNPIYWEIRNKIPLFAILKLGKRDYIA